MKIIVAGSRCFNDYNKLSKVLDEYIGTKCGVKIISGGARGADLLGERYAIEHGIEVERHPAEWDKYGKFAGLKRNEDMARSVGESGILFAFWDGISRGTGAMIKYAKKYGLEIHIIGV